MTLRMRYSQPTASFAVKQRSRGLRVFYLIAAPTAALVTGVVPTQMVSEDTWAAVEQVRVGTERSAKENPKGAKKLLLRLTPTNVRFGKSHRDKYLNAMEPKTPLSVLRKVLQKHPHMVNKRLYNDRTPLHVALEKKDWDRLEFMLQYGKINRTEQGPLLLHKLVSSSPDATTSPMEQSDAFLNWILTTLLRKAQLKINQRDANGYTALDLAEGYARTDPNAARLAKLLKQRGATHGEGVNNNNNQSGQVEQQKSQVTQENQQVSEHRLLQQNQEGPSERTTRKTELGTGTMVPIKPSNVEHIKNKKLARMRFIGEPLAQLRAAFLPQALNVTRAALHVSPLLRNPDLNAPQSSEAILPEVLGRSQQRGKSRQKNAYINSGRPLLALMDIPLAEPSSSSNTKAKRLLTAMLPKSLMDSQEANGGHTTYVPRSCSTEALLESLMTTAKIKPPERSFLTRLIPDRLILSVKRLRRKRLAKLFQLVAASTPSSENVQKLWEFARRSPRLINERFAGTSLLQHALAKGKWQYALVLLHHGADASIPTWDKGNALQTFLTHFPKSTLPKTPGFVERFVELLVRKGASLTTRDCSNATPFTAARRLHSSWRGRICDVLRQLESQHE